MIFLPKTNGNAPMLVNLHHCELLELSFPDYLPLASDNPTPLDDLEWYNKPVLSRWLLPLRSISAEVNTELPIANQDVFAD